jgi:arginine decarboxylase
MLDYVGYSLADLRASYAERVAAANLSPERAQELSEALEAGLTGYTYLSDEPLV